LKRFKSNWRIIGSGISDSRIEYLKPEVFSKNEILDILVDYEREVKLKYQMNKLKENNSDCTSG